MPDAQSMITRKLRSGITSITPRWPCALGDRPEDAIGKDFRLVMDGVEFIHTVMASDGDTLLLNQGIEERDFEWTAPIDAALEDGR